MWKWFVVVGVLFMAWEGSCELARLQRWSSEDPAWWRRRLLAQIEQEASE